MFAAGAAPAICDAFVAGGKEIELLPDVEVEGVEAPALAAAAAAVWSATSARCLAAKKWATNMSRGSRIYVHM